MSEANTPPRPVRRYRGRTTEQLREERRERLLRTGARLIGRQGYPSTSIERVCAGARVSTRHFYEHFSSREALLEALFEQFIANALREIGAALGETDDEDMTRVVLGAIAAFARFCMENPDQARIALVETVGVSTALEQRRRQSIRQFADLIAELAQEMVQQGVLPEGDYSLAGIALVGATHELLIEWLSGATGLTSEEMERQITGIFRAIIKGTQSRGAAPGQ